MQKPKSEKQKQSPGAQAKLAVYDAQGKKIEELDSIFNDKPNPAVVSQAVTMYLANKRRGLAQIKTRGEVSGGGKKPWKQKGTGRARAGSIRSPLWRHGGVVFGPQARSFRYGLSAKILRRALSSALSQKGLDDNLVVLDKLDVSSPKAKEMRGLLDNLKLKEKVLFVAAKFDRNLRLASRNIRGLELALAKDVNALDVLRASKVVLFRDTLETLKNRLSSDGKK